MKTTKIALLSAAVTLAGLPLAAGAFGFGASKHDYPPGPWGYGPYGGPPPQAPGAQGQAAPGPMPYGPPPGARDVRSMWGSGPGMSWGPRDPEAAEAERARKREHYRNPWKWTQDWKYESPYKDAQPWVSPFDTPMGGQPSK